MFNPIFRRFFWKEFRMLWPLWVAVAAIFLFVNIGFLRNYDVQKFADVRCFWIFTSAALLPLLYGLGCAGTQFAWELESGTFSRLRAMPVSSGKVVLAKLIWTVFSSLLLAVTLCGSSYFLTGREWLSGEETLNFFNVYGLGFLEVIAWGTIFSMASRSPLMATIRAGLAWGMTFFFLTTLYALFITKSQMDRASLWVLYCEVWPYRLLLLLILFGVMVRRSRRWFDYWRRKESRSEEARISDVKGRFKSGYLMGDGGFLALCQQCLRRSRSLWITTSSIAFYAAIICLVGSFKHGTPGDFLVGLAMMGAFFCCTIIMSGVFSPDQSDRGFRFFAHHGITVRQVWFSRILVSGIFFFILWSIAFTTIWLVNNHDPQEREAAFYVGIVLGPCVFMCGAFFSILCKSRVIAWTWSLAMGYGCCLLALLVFYAQVSMFLMLLPCFAFAMCSYWGVSDRIHERSWKQVSLKRIGLFFGCMVVFVALGITQRVTSVPNVSLFRRNWVIDYERAWKSPESQRLFEDFMDLDNFRKKRVKVDRPLEWLSSIAVSGQEGAAEAEGGDDSQAVAKLPFNGFITIFDESALNKLLEIAKSLETTTLLEVMESRGEVISLDIAKRFAKVNVPIELDWSKAFDDDGDSVIANRLTFLPSTTYQHRLLVTAEYYSRMGEPEKSLDCLLATIRLTHPLDRDRMDTVVYAHLPRWAAGPGVTPELIQKAIRRIEQIEPLCKSLQRSALAGYYGMQARLDATKTEFTIDDFDKMFLKALPWERARLGRILKISADSAINFWEWYGKFLYEPTDIDSVGRLQQITFSSQKIYDQVERMASPLEVIVYQIRAAQNFHGKIGNLWQAELFRRLALATLAIRAYQLEHDGVLPKTLDEVTSKLSKPDLLSMPCGPAFHFRREGFDEKECIQPGFRFHWNNIDCEEPSIIGNLSGTPCIVLDTIMLYEAYGLFPNICSDAGRDKILDLSERKFFSIPTVYPLPFKEKKPEHGEKKEE